MAVVRDEEFDAALQNMHGPQPVPILGGDVPPADLLFRYDSIRYTQALTEWRESQLGQLLGADDNGPLYRRNKERFDELRRLLPRGRIIPFVGAGLGVSCGYPTWRDYLLKCAEEHGPTFAAAIKARLDNDHYEEATAELFQHFGAAGFNESFERCFGREYPPRGPVTYLWKLTKSCIITTNFDRLIERVVNISHSELFAGRRAQGFHRALADGERALLKLHGDLHQPDSRVLTRDEYDKSYGAGAKVNFKLPVPDALSRVFSHYRLLFLGCSLAQDRTMALLYQLVAAARNGEGDFPRHYAIAEAPEDPARLLERERFLNQRMIFPIWYPHRRHGHLDGFLKSLTRDL